MKLLLYCTKGKPYLTYDIDINKKYYFIDELYKDKNTLNGTIPCECDFEVEEISVTYADYYHEELAYDTHTLTYDELLEKSCLNNQQLDDYLCAKDGYAIHIKNLKVFDKPRELRFYYQKYKNDKHLYNVEKAPQNMMKVIGKQGDEYILISIRPEWLCKILNGEKTIEVRKKVLKEMTK